MCEGREEAAAAKKRKNYVSHFFMTLKLKLENLRKSCREIICGWKSKSFCHQIPHRFSIIRYKQEILSQLHKHLEFL